MRTPPAWSKAFAATVAALLGIFPTGACVQHASDNPITSADDAFGLTLGLESVDLYNPGLVRGFSPITAGNMRVAAGASASMAVCL